MAEMRYGLLATRNSKYYNIMKIKKIKTKSLKTFNELQWRIPT